MKNTAQIKMMRYTAEAKMIDGAETAVFELSDGIGNCVILTGEIYGRSTLEKLHELGRKHGLLILANELSVLYERPEKK